MRVPTLTAGPPPNAEPAVTLMATRSSVFPGAYPLAEPAPEPRRHEGVKRPAASTEAPPALACSQRPLPGRGHRAPNGGSMPPISAAAQPLQRRRAARLRPAFPSAPPGSLPRAAGTPTRPVYPRAQFRFAFSACAILSVALMPRTVSPALSTCSRARPGFRSTEPGHL